MLGSVSVIGRSFGIILESINCLMLVSHGRDRRHTRWEEERERERGRGGSRGRSICGIMCWDHVGIDLELSALFWDPFGNMSGSFGSGFISDILWNISGSVWDLWDTCWINLGLF